MGLIVSFSRLLDGASPALARWCTYADLISRHDDLIDGHIPLHARGQPAPDGCLPTQATTLPVVISNFEPWQGQVMMVASSVPLLSQRGASVPDRIHCLTYPR